MIVGDSVTYSRGSDGKGGFTYEKSLSYVAGGTAIYLTVDANADGPGVFASADAACKANLTTFAQAVAADVAAVKP